MWINKIWSIECGLEYIHKWNWNLWHHIVSSLETDPFYLLESRTQHFNRNRNNTITIAQQSTQTHPQRLCLHLEHAGTWPGISWAASTNSSAPILFSSHCYKLIMGWALTVDIILSSTIRHLSIVSFLCFCDWLWDMIHCTIDCINNWQRMYGKILAVLQSFIVLQTFCIFRHSEK